MRSLLTINFPRLALGVGILILVAGISVSLTLLQPDQGTGSTPAANQGRPAEVATAAGLPASSTGNTSVTGLAEPDAGSTGRGLIGAEDVAISPLAELDPVGVDPGMMAAEDVAMYDSAELEIREEGPPAAPGGPGEVASFQDGAELVVRDADGNIKRQVTAR